MIRTTTERNGNRETINIGAAIIHNTQRMRHLNLFVFAEAIFEPPLTAKHANSGASILFRNYFSARAKRLTDSSTEYLQTKCSYVQNWHGVIILNRSID